LIVSSLKPAPRAPTAPIPICRGNPAMNCASKVRFTGGFLALAMDA
jgi:hypothetical protein